jgi:hypothetical protein
VVGEFVVVVVLSDEICVREIVLTGYLEIFFLLLPVIGNYYSQFAYELTIFFFSKTSRFFTLLPRLVLM